MRKTTTILGVGLLVWVLAASALAAGPSALLNTTWSGALTTVARAVDGNVTITTDNATLTFTGENGDFLAGTITPLSSPPVNFAGIREGNSLQMTAEDSLMSAQIFKGHSRKKGTAPPSFMIIQGRNLAEGGSMFEGTLTKH